MPAPGVEHRAREARRHPGGAEVNEQGLRGPYRAASGLSQPVRGARRAVFFDTDTDKKVCVTISNFGAPVAFVINAI